MPRLARAEVFCPDEVAVVHVMNRVVRRCFLLGTDSFTGKNYDHRKIWIERQLQRLAAFFGIDLLGFAILSNHFHLILRSRPDVASVWDGNGHGDTAPCVLSEGLKCRWTTTRVGQLQRNSLPVGMLRCALRDMGIKSLVGSGVSLASS